MKQWIKDVLVFIGLNTPGEISPEEVNELKSFLKNSFIVFKKYQESREDDETSVAEWFDILKSAMPIIGNIKNWNKIKSQILNFKYGDGKDLVLFIVDQGVIPDKAEEVIIHLLAFIELQIKGYQDHVKPIITLIKK